MTTFVIIASIISGILLGVLSNYIYDLLRKKQYLPDNPPAKTLVIIIFVFLPFIFVVVLREILPDVMRKPETDVITYIPREPNTRKVGNCFHASISIKRPGVWRCAVGNLIYDPCFEIPVNLTYSNDVHKIICNSSPDDQDNAFLLDLTEPLPEPWVAEDAQLEKQQVWMVELMDGRFCRFITGAGSGFYDIRENFGCDPDNNNHTLNLFGYPRPGRIWKAKGFVSTESGEVIREEEVSLRRVWR